MHREAQVSPEKKNSLDFKKVMCRFCKSENVVKKGFRKTQRGGKQQRWICRDCNRSFTIDSGFWKMKNPEHLVTMSLDQYYMNLSSRKVSISLSNYLNNEATHQSILNWVRKYSQKVKPFTESLKLNLSGETYLDETEIKCKKKAGIFWSAIDGNTKYIVGYLYSYQAQNVKDAMKILKTIKDRQQTKFIQTDGLVHYPTAMKKMFYSNKVGRLTVNHIILNVRKTGRHNVKIERFFRNVKERTQLMYWFKNFRSANDILDGYVIRYNFVRNHMTLGKTPAEEAGFAIDLGKNKWRKLIEIATLIKNHTP